VQSPLGPGSRSASPFRAGSPGGATFSSLNNSSGLLLSRAEAQLRKVLEEEISVEMQRELALQQVRHMVPVQITCRNCNPVLGVVL
jgi:hypothetical protein